MELVLIALIAVLSGALVWSFRRTDQQAAHDRDRLLTLVERLAIPEPLPEPPRTDGPPALTPLRGIVAVDPTDGIIPDTPVGSTPLAQHFPQVDPWLIGEPEYPESIDEVDFPADDMTQVMLPDGTWAPMDAAYQRKDEQA